MGYMRELMDRACEPLQSSLSAPRAGPGPPPVGVKKMAQHAISRNGKARGGPSSS